MSKVKIENIKTETKGFNYSLHTIIELDCLFPTEINIKISGISRNDISYSIQTISTLSGTMVIKSETITHPSKSNYWKSIIKDLKYVLRVDDFVLDNDDESKIINYICDSISKGESRYGNPVINRSENKDCDALITIKGKDFYEIRGFMNINNFIEKFDIQSDENYSFRLIDINNNYKINKHIPHRLYILKNNYNSIGQLIDDIYNKNDGYIINIEKNIITINDE